MSVRHAVLALLCEGPKYGLQLRHEFEARSGDVWPLNVGQVYTILQRLERGGLVESEPGDDSAQKPFRITQAGGEELRRWLEPPAPGSGPPRDELVIKVLVALRLPGVDVHEVVQAHRRWAVEEMSAFTRVKEDASATDVGLLLVVDAEILRLDAIARWLDAAEARLRASGTLDHDPPRPDVPVPARGAGRRRAEASR